MIMKEGSRKVLGERRTIQLRGDYWSDQADGNLLLYSGSVASGLVTGARRKRDKAGAGGEKCLVVGREPNLDLQLRLA